MLKGKTVVTDVIRLTLLCQQMNLPYQLIVYITFVIFIVETLLMVSFNSILKQLLIGGFHCVTSVAKRKMFFKTRWL